MVYKYKYAPMSPLQDQEKNTQYIVKFNDFDNGFTILDDLCVTTLAEIVKTVNTYKILLFGSLYAVIDENLVSTTSELEIIESEPDCYNIKLNNDTTALVTLQKGSVLLSTDDTSKLVLALSVALILADRKFAKKETAENTDSQKETFSKVDIKKAISNFKNKIISLKPISAIKNNPIKTAKFCALILGVFLIIFGVVSTISGTYNNKSLRKTTATVSSNGEWIKFKVRALEYTLKLDHTESKGSDITIYYTLNNEGIVNNVYYKPPVAYINLIPSAIGVVLTVGSVCLLCIKGRTASKPEQER